MRPNTAVIDFLNALGHAMCDVQAQYGVHQYRLARRVPIELLRGFQHPPTTNDQALINEAIRQRVAEYDAADQLTRLTDEMGLYRTDQEAS